MQFCNICRHSGFSWSCGVHFLAGALRVRQITRESVSLYAWLHWFITLLILDYRFGNTNQSKESFMLTRPSGARSLFAILRQALLHGPKATMTPNGLLFSLAQTYSSSKQPPRARNQRFCCYLHIDSDNTGRTSSFATLKTVSMAYTKSEYRNNTHSELSSI